MHSTAKTIPKMHPIKKLFYYYSKVNFGLYSWDRINQNTKMKIPLIKWKTPNGVVLESNSNPSRTYKIQFIPES